MEINVTDIQFRALLDLIMCSDPWPVLRTIFKKRGDHVLPYPVTDGRSQSAIIKFADKEAKLRKFSNWVVAFHEFEPRRIK
jgi:hypothetical protein